MLSERLRDRDLFKGDGGYKKMSRALTILDECAGNLVMAMRTIESMGIMPREDIEDYVIEAIESSEMRYYTIEEDDFDTFIRELLRR